MVMVLVIRVLMGCGMSLLAMWLSALGDCGRCESQQKCGQRSQTASGPCERAPGSLFQFRLQFLTPVFVNGVTAAASIGTTGIETTSGIDQRAGLRLDGC